LARGAYTGVREHDKGPRTQLADFFNILLVGGERSALAVLLGNLLTEPGFF